MLWALCALAAVGALALLVALAYTLANDAAPAINAFGLSFVGRQTWNPVTGQFGAAAFLFGTATSSLIAIGIATPLSIGIALYLSEIAPARVRTPISTLIDLLAGIPSVVLGLWGILVLGPFVAGSLEPALHSTLGFIPLFAGAPSALGLLTASLVLTIMVVPIVSAVTREVFDAVPGELKEAALALGATRWEMVRTVMLPHARSGIVGAAMLGIGRALGEAIAVTQVIGGATAIHVSLFGPADTIASRIASQYEGATSSLQISALALLGLILLIMTLAVNIVARLIVKHAARGQAHVA